MTEILQNLTMIGTICKFFVTITSIFYIQLFILCYRYHMYGSTVETLKVFAKLADATSGQLGTLVWSMSGEKPNDWYRAAVNLNFSSPFKV